MKCKQLGKNGCALCRQLLARKNPDGRGTVALFSCSKRAKRGLHTLLQSLELNRAFRCNSLVTGPGHSHSAVFVHWKDVTPEAERIFDSLNSFVLATTLYTSAPVVDYTDATWPMSFGQHESFQATAAARFASGCPQGVYPTFFDHPLSWRFFASGCTHM